MSYWLHINSTEEKGEQRRRKMAGWTIAILCIGILILASAASGESLSRFVIFLEIFLILQISF